jgi:dihydroorotase
MTRVYDLILRGGTVVTPGGQAQTDIGIIGERIAFMGDLSQAAAGEIYGAKSRGRPTRKTSNRARAAP